MSESDSMVERVAMEACFAFNGDVGRTVAWEDERLKALWRKAARAAIAAMREPTEAMKDDGYAAACGHDYGLSPPNLEISPATWRATIDAALK